MNAFLNWLTDWRPRTLSREEMETIKREAVIARVMRTGEPCYAYPDGTCARCNRGPCPGPVEKYYG